MSEHVYGPSEVSLDAIEQCNPLGGAWLTATVQDLAKHIRELESQAELLREDVARVADARDAALEEARKANDYVERAREEVRSATRSIRDATDALDKVEEERDEAVRKRDEAKSDLYALTCRLDRLEGTNTALTNAVRSLAVAL